MGTNAPETQVSKSIAVGAAEKGAEPEVKESAKPAEGEFKVAEVREDGTVIVEMDDGRMFPVPALDGEKPRKGSKVNILADGLDKDGVPLNPVAKVL